MAVPESPKRKEEWLAESHFHDLNVAQVLAEVERRVKDSDQPLVLLDLDSTLYEVGPRTYQILKEWISGAGSRVNAAVIQALTRLEPKQVGYSLRDTFRTVGLNLEKPEIQHAWEEAKKFWGPLFFSSEYLRYDQPYPGAADFTRKLYALGAQIVYLTGRDEPGMGEGTRARLKQDGFPWDVPRTHLLLKASAKTPDIQHKVGAAAYIRSHGTLIASFENEPANLSALYSEFPDAMHVYVDTVSSDHEAIPRQGLYRIHGFGVV